MKHVRRYRGMWWLESCLLFLPLISCSHPYSPAPCSLSIFLVAPFPIAPSSYVPHPSIHPQYTPTPSRPCTHPTHIHPLFWPWVMTHGSLWFLCRVTGHHWTAAGRQFSNKLQSPAWRRGMFKDEPTWAKSIIISSSSHSLPPQMNTHHYHQANLLQEL